MHIMCFKHLYGPILSIRKATYKIITCSLTAVISSDVKARSSDFQLFHSSIGNAALVASLREKCEFGTTAVIRDAHVLMLVNLKWWGQLHRKKINFWNKLFQVDFHSQRVVWTHSDSSGVQRLRYLWPDPAEIKLHPGASCDAPFSPPMHFYKKPNVWKQLWVDAVNCSIQNQTERAAAETTAKESEILKILWLTRKQLLERLQRDTKQTHTHTQMSTKRQKTTT